MIIAITYGNQLYERAKRFNCRMALKYGADKAIAYGPEDIAEEFKKKNSHIWNQAKGGGYWIWKPYVIYKTLCEMQDDDYLVYTDAGAIFIDSINYLVEAMDKAKTDIMAFCLTYPERWYTKRDIFLLMECDSPQYTDTRQNIGGYILLKKTERTKQFIYEFLQYVQDERIVTDIPNRLGLPDYEGFKESRHDQSCFSLLCKKYGVQPFRDPSQFGNNKANFPADVICRSNYPQVINSFRDPQIGNMFQLRYGKKRWYKYITGTYYKTVLLRFKANLINRRNNEEN